MEPPSFSTNSPPTVTAVPGSDASIVLPLPSGSPPFQYEWSRAGAKLDDRFKPADDAGGVRLTISAASSGDSGVYTLQASNAAGYDTTRVQLEVTPDEKPIGDDPPTFLRRLQDLTVKVGTRTRFLVEIVSSTECRVTWYRNERRLLEAERIALVRDGNFWCADISAVSVDDSGRWTCTAENVGGRSSCSAHLNVLVPKAYKRPEFVEELRALLTEQGTVSLECKVVGVPTPVLRWFKDSREIKAGDVFALTANAEDPTSLGTYTCEAVNCMGRAYSSSKVHVIGRASREGSVRPVSGVALEPPPIFTKELEDQFVRICEPLTLSCHIVVPPWPRSIVWYNKEGKIESSDKYRVLEDGVGGYLLVIPSAEWQDEGEWKCVATSTGGRIGITTCYVSMDVPKNYRKPRFMENLQAILTEEGLVSFECKVVGFPTPVLSWFKDGQELKPGDVYQLTGTNSLGSYCCIARNCMGHASSSAELTVEDIQNQLNEEEKLQLFSKNQAPKFLQGLKSVEAKIDEPFRFTIKVAIPPEPTVLWYRDDQPVDESSRCHHGKEERGVFYLDIQSLEFMDQAEWKCVAMNDYGHSITSCFLKLLIPRHYKKPRFLENLQAILSDEGAVNLECKVIGVPQPVLKWYKDGEELKPGDIHRIISGQDGTCCLGTYTCEAQNCMGIAASSASLLGFEDSIKAKSKKNVDEQTLQRNLSLSTIHEERTSQMYDTPVGDITLDDKGEITYSFDGKEVSVSLYETPDLTEEEALQIVEMYADQLSENVTEHNVVELPPLRFVKETSTSGNLLMEAIIIDVSPEYFTSPEEDLRTEADIEDISIADENGPPQLSQDQEMDGEDYLEKTMALLSDEKTSFPKKTDRKKSDSQRSVDDYFSLSRDQSLSEEKKDDDTQVLSESDLQSFASARSSGKPKSKSSKPSIEDGQESSEITKTVLLNEDLHKQNELESIMKNKKERRSRSSRRSSSGSEKSVCKMKEEALEMNSENALGLSPLDQQSTKEDINNISLSLAKLINDVQMVERDIILKSELMSTAATASRSLEIINSLITPLSEIHSISEAIKEAVSESFEVTTSLFNRLPQTLNSLYQSLTIIEKCIDVESENKTLVKKTCTNIVEKCGDDLNKLVREIRAVVNKSCPFLEEKCVSSIQTTTNELHNIVMSSKAAIKESQKLSDRIDTNLDTITPELKHLQKTQKAVYELRNPLKSLLYIAREVNVSSFVSTENITNSQIILSDMSTPIQDLQNALEQIEYLSVAETQSDFPKYNTEIIETVMNSVIKLRTSFEQLSVEAGTMEKVDVLNEILLDIKHNINEISDHLDIFETKLGSFNILQNENKLEALQKMAQILINLENNLIMLEIVPSLKMHMADFHKNLTKVLEHVIESNDAKKYLTFLEICDAVNRLNALLKNVDSKDILGFAGICNNLKLVQAHIEKNEFTPELNLSILSNISDLLLYVQETIYQADISTYSMNSENVEDLSIRCFEEEKLKIVLEQIEKAVTSISNVVSLETTNNLVIKEALNKIIPTLEEIKCCVASLNVNVTEQENNISDMSNFSFTQAVANPLCELNLGIGVLTQIICEKASDSYEHNLLRTELATPLVELRNALEILQHDVISQNGEKVTDLNISNTVANAVQSVQSCIIMIQEQNLLENADELSTLEDISAIKTSADILSIDDYISPNVQEITTEINTEMMGSTSTEWLKTLSNYILILQSPESMNTLKALSELEENSCIKSILAGLDTLHSAIDKILHPIMSEKSKKPNILNSIQLSTILQPLQEMLQNLSVIDENNMRVESATQMDHIILLSQNLSKLKNCIRDSLGFILAANETTDATLEISAKINTLKKLCEELRNNLDTSEKYAFIESPELLLFDNSMNTILSTTSTSQDINIAQVKLNIEGLQRSILMAQEELIGLVVDDPTVLAHEAKILNSVDAIQKTISDLGQLRFIDIVEVSDSSISPQAGEEVQHELLRNIESLLEINANRTQNVSQELQNNICKSTVDFVKTFNDEITLMCYLSKQKITPSLFIKMMQIFFELTQSLKHFHFHQERSCPSEFLSDWMDNSEECLKSIKSFLIDVLHNQSHLIFDFPMANLKNDEIFLHNILESNNNANICDFAKLLINTMQSVRPWFENIQADVLNELELSNVNLDVDDDTEEKFNTLYRYLAEQIERNIITDNNEQEFEALFRVIKKHADCKRVKGAAKKITFIICLSDCLSILKSTTKDQPLTKNGSELTKVLSTLSENVEFCCKEIIYVVNQNVESIEKRDITKELERVRSKLEAINKVSEKLEICLNWENLSLDNNTVTVVKGLVNNIQIIKTSLQNIESTYQIEVNIQPIQEIDRILHILLSKAVKNDENIKLKEKTDTLIQHMEHYIEIIEIVEEVSAVLKLEDLRKSADIARELRESITSESSPDIILSGQELNIRAEQKQLVQNLQEALTLLNIEDFDYAQELATPISKDVRQQILEVVSDIQNDLVALTSIYVLLENSEKKETDESCLISTMKLNLDESVNLIEKEQYAIIDSEVNQEESQLTQNEIPAILQIEEVQPTTDILTSLNININEEDTKSKQNFVVQDEEDLKTDTDITGFEIKDVSVKRPDTIKESLIQHINEYLSEDVRKILPFENFEPFEQSLQFAEEVRNNAILEDTCPIPHHEYLKKQLDLVLKLQKSLKEIHDKNLYNTAEPTLQALNNKDSLQSVTSVVHNLLKSLQMYVVLLNTSIQSEAEFIEETCKETPNTSVTGNENVTALIENQTPVKQNIVEEESHSNEINILPENVTEVVIVKQDVEEIPKESAALMEITLDKETLINQENIADPKNVHGMSTNKHEATLKDNLNGASLLLDTEELKNLEKTVTVQYEEVQTGADLLNEAANSSVMHELESLLQEVNEILSVKYPFDEYSEELKDTLEQVQTVIMKLKCDFNGSTDDVLNENIEDLECNVRSVQLQINESSPPALLKEACANLLTLVASMKNIYNAQNNSSENDANDALYLCTNDAEKSLELLDKISTLTNNSSVENMIVTLNGIKDTMKSLKFCFSNDAESLIVRGIEIQQNLDHVEDKVFALEKELEANITIDVNLRDSIITAIHSIYGSISNMRGTISSIQKKYMYDNYGQPSDNILKSIKNVNQLLGFDSKDDWKQFAKSLRKVLNHFEDIKFYINLDKTARLPSDSAFTKIILGELRTVLSDVVLQNISNSDTKLKDKVEDAVSYISEILDTMENKTTLEVKEKIPIFKKLSVKIFELTYFIQTLIKKNLDMTDQSITENKLLTENREVEKVTPETEKRDENQDQLPQSSNVISSAVDNRIEILADTLEVIQDEFKDTLHGILKETEIKAEYDKGSENQSNELDQIKSDNNNNKDNEQIKKYNEISTLELQNESQDIFAKSTINETKMPDTVTEQNLLNQHEIGQDFEISITPIQATAENQCVAEDNIIEEQTNESNLLEKKIEEKDNQANDMAYKSIEDENKTEDVHFDFEVDNTAENISMQVKDKTEYCREIREKENMYDVKQEEFGSISSNLAEDQSLDLASKQIEESKATNLTEKSENKDVIREVVDQDHDFADVNKIEEVPFEIELKNSNENISTQEKDKPEYQTEIRENVKNIDVVQEELCSISSYQPDDRAHDLDNKKIEDENKQGDVLFAVELKNSNENISMQEEDEPGYRMEIREKEKKYDVKQEECVSICSNQADDKSDDLANKQIGDENKQGDVLFAVELKNSNENISLQEKDEPEYQTEIRENVKHIDIVQEKLCSISSYQPDDKAHDLDNKKIEEENKQGDVLFSVELKNSNESISMQEKDEPEYQSEIREKVRINDVEKEELSSISSYQSDDKSHDLPNKQIEDENKQGDVLFAVELKNRNESISMQEKDEPEYQTEIREKVRINDVVKEELSPISSYQSDDKSDDLANKQIGDENKQGDVLFAVELKNSNENISLQEKDEPEYQTEIRENVKHIDIVQEKLCSISSYQPDDKAHDLDNKKIEDENKQGDVLFAVELKNSNESISMQEMDEPEYQTEIREKVRINDVVKEELSPISSYQSDDKSHDLANKQIEDENKQGDVLFTVELKKSKENISMREEDEPGYRMEIREKEKKYDVKQEECVSICSNQADDKSDDLASKKIEDENKQEDVLFAVELKISDEDISMEEKNEPEYCMEIRETEKKYDDKQEELGSMRSNQDDDQAHDLANRLTEESNVSNITEKSEESVMKTNQNEAENDCHFQEVQNRENEKSLQLKYEDVSMLDKQAILQQQLTQEEIQNITKDEQIDDSMETHTSFKSSSNISESVNIEEAKEEKKYITLENPHLILIANPDNENSKAELVQNNSEALLKESKQNEIEVKKDTDTEDKQQTEGVLNSIELHNIECSRSEKLQDNQNNIKGDDIAEEEITKLSELAILQVKEDVTEKCEEIITDVLPSESKHLEIIIKEKENSIGGTLQKVVIKDLKISSAEVFEDLQNVKEMPVTLESGINSVENEETTHAYKTVPEYKKIDHSNTANEKLTEDKHQEECVVTDKTRQSDVFIETIQGSLSVQLESQIEKQQGILSGNEDNQLVCHDFQETNNDKVKNLQHDAKQAECKEKQLDHFNTSCLDMEKAPEENKQQDDNVFQNILKGIDAIAVDDVTDIAEKNEGACEIHGVNISFTGEVGIESKLKDIEGDTISTVLSESENKEGQHTKEKVLNSKECKKEDTTLLADIPQSSEKLNTGVNKQQTTENIILEKESDSRSVIFNNLDKGIKKINEEEIQLNQIISALDDHYDKAMKYKMENTGLSTPGTEQQESTSKVFKTEPGVDTIVSVETPDFKEKTLIEEQHLPQSEEIAKNYSKENLLFEEQYLTQSKEMEKVNSRTETDFSEKNGEPNKTIETSETIIKNKDIAEIKLETQVDQKIKTKVKKGKKTKQSDKKEVKVQEDIPNQIHVDPGKSEQENENVEKIKNTKHNPQDGDLKEQVENLSKNKPKQEKALEEELQNKKNHDETAYQKDLSKEILQHELEIDDNNILEKNQWDEEHLKVNKECKELLQKILIDENNKDQDIQKTHEGVICHELENIDSGCNQISERLNENITGTIITMVEREVVEEGQELKQPTVLEHKINDQVTDQNTTEQSTGRKQVIEVKKLDKINTNITEEEVLETIQRDTQKLQNIIDEANRTEDFVQTVSQRCMPNKTNEYETLKSEKAFCVKNLSLVDGDTELQKPVNLYPEALEDNANNASSDYSVHSGASIQEKITTSSNVDNHESTKINKMSLPESKHRDRELKQRPSYIDCSEKDYELEFARPSGYTSKPFDIDDSRTEFQISGKTTTMYKAQTLVHEAQLKSNLPPYIDQGTHISEQYSDLKPKTKSVSDSRSTVTEKRAGFARDIRRKPVFSTHLTDRTAVESSRVKLTCSILSSTDPVISWYKNGILIDSKQKCRTKHVDGLITLEILNAVPSDSGEYSCTVENENGSITSTANLKVYPGFEASPIPPTFTRSIRDVYHLHENELVLECRIRGQPLPTITWFKDNRPIILNERYQAHYLADGVCRLTIHSPNEDDSGKYTCRAENSMWSDQITHDVQFTSKESRRMRNIARTETIRINRQTTESRRPHFTNVLSDHKVVSGGTIGLQVEISGSPTRVEWLREGRSVIENYRNAQTYIDHGLYTLALSDVTEKESGLYTCRAWSTHGNVDMNASITVVQPNQFEGKPATIISRPVKDLLISVGEDLNISFRVQGEPKPKVFFIKGIRDITNSQRVCKMTSDDYVKFTLKRSVVSDAGTYCVFARNAYGCDRAFVTVVIRQRASSDNLISDWTYPMDDLAISVVDRNYKSVPDRIPSEPNAVDGGNNWVSLAWPKPDSQVKAPILAYRVESWLLGKEGGARWTELGITPRNSFDAFNLKQGEEYHFRVTPRNRYGWGESVQTSTPIGIGLTGDRPEFVEILPGQLKVLVGETATLCCSFKGNPIPEIMWMKNGHEVEEETERVTIELSGNNTSLQINRINLDDEGRYSCEATNIHGRSSTYSRMAVITDRQIWAADAKLKRERSAGANGEYPPQFTMRLRDRRVQATYPVRLTCQVIGCPSPIVTWFKNGEEITLDGRQTTSQDEYFHTLEIAPTTLEDGGVYEAMARNGCGAISCRCNLVVDKGIRAYIAPEFCCGFEPLYRVCEGDELRISAVVEAYPSVGVTWYRDGVRLRTSRRAVMTLDRDGQIELALASVAARDAGVYTCTASNEVGRASTSGKVEVIQGDYTGETPKVPPIVISSDVPYSKEPMFIRKPRSSEAREGDTVLLECEVIGDPKPDVYWLRDFLKPDYYRDASHFKRVGAGPAYRFEIPHAKLDYTGAYSIVAKNIHGEAKAIISLQILAKDPSCSSDTHNIRYGRVDIIPRFDKELTDLLCYDGDAIEFECRVSGNPDPDIRWFHYTEVLPDCSDFESSFEHGTARLKIKQVTAEDEGTYTCEASNNMGKATSSACLVIYPPGEPNTLSQRLRRPPALLSAASTPRSTPRTTPVRSQSRTPGPDLRRLCSPSREIAPKFYTYPYNKVVEEGDTVVFQCAVRGLPPPWASWDKDGIIITPTARISVREKDDMFRILEIEQVTVEDVGLYRVTLENDYGRAEASARLEVISQTGKFYGSRSYSVSPRKCLPYRRRTPSLTRQD